MRGCGRLCETAFWAVLHVPVGACCTSTGTSASTPWGAVGSALGVAQGGAVDPDGVALMAQSTQERLDERLVAEKRLPVGIVKVRRNDCRLAAVAFLHQFEEDVGLFRPEIDVAQLSIHKQSIR